MSEAERREHHEERLRRLSECGPGTDMGQLLRQFWHPVAVAAALKPGLPRPITVLGEDLTLYRGESGRPYVIGGRCAHRCTVLHTGWVEGEQLRCIYHGWKYDGSGQCTETPAEASGFEKAVRIAGYPAREYAGLIFVFMGDPALAHERFELQRKPEFEAADRFIIAREQSWPCNFFQQVENSLDAVHVSFVHMAGVVGYLGDAVGRDMPTLEYQETSAGIRQIATRQSNVRISDWTFPNYNRIVTPGRTKDAPWIHRGVWNVPAHDQLTLKLHVYAIKSLGAEADRETREHFDRFASYNPADHHDALFERREWPEDPSLQLTPAQDYVAIRGQGRIVDRRKEYLGASDAGIALLRRICWREMDALKEGRPAKRWAPIVEKVDMREKSAAQQ